jgi:hypothetical protein
VRNVSQATKDAVYAAYGISVHFNGATGEVDHLVSLELGGSNVGANLFPEAAAPRPGSHEKDRLENRLHAEVCSGQITSARPSVSSPATGWRSTTTNSADQPAGGASAPRVAAAPRGGRANA